MRRPFIVGNWKMNGTEPEAARLIGALLPLLPSDGPARAEIAIAPPFTALHTVAEAVRGAGIALAAQNLHPASHGAFTGEISAGMLAALGVRYAIVGHSERRRLFAESDEEVGRKAAAASAAGIVPILCVGEEERERLDGRTLDVIGRQLRAGIGKMGSFTGSGLVVAYEPVWAIGTGRTATPEQASEVHTAIAGLLRELAGAEVAGEIRILYGGSATPDTAERLLRSQNVDGALVGGASLVPESFARIVELAGA